MAKQSAGEKENKIQFQAEKQRLEKFWTRRRLLCCAGWCWAVTRCIPGRAVLSARWGVSSCGHHSRQGSTYYRTVVPNTALHSQTRGCHAARTFSSSAQPIFLPLKLIIPFLKKVLKLWFLLHSITIVSYLHKKCVIHFDAANQYYSAC